MLGAEDSYPVTKGCIRNAVKGGASDHPDMAAILERPDISLPLLRQAYETASDSETRLKYANILGMMGDGTGIEALLDRVRGAEWDRGWPFTGGGQFGRCLSRMDCYLVSLAHIGDDRAWDAVAELGRRLGPDHRFSHHRATAIAFEKFARQEGARILATVLEKPEMTGHAVGRAQAMRRREFLGSREKNLRELVLARALYRCGDHGAVGRDILQSYRSDIRGHYARHAQAVLEGGTGRA